MWRASQAFRLGGVFPHVCPQKGQRYATPCLCVCGLVSQRVDAGLPKAARAAAIDTIRHVTCSFRLKSDINFENYREEIQEIFNHIRDAQDRALNELPSAESHNKLAKIANLVEGTIDHFDRDDAMDLLYQIKDVLK